MTLAKENALRQPSADTATNFMFKHTALRVVGQYAKSNNLIERTYKVWQPRLQRNLTNEVARQITENGTGLFAILAEWPRAARLVPANDDTAAVHIDIAGGCHDR